MVILGNMVLVYNPNPGEAEAGRLQVWGQPGLYSKTPFLEKIKKRSMVLLEQITE
jgi:hypothetical protein